MKTEMWYWKPMPQFYYNQKQLLAQHEGYYAHVGNSRDLTIRRHGKPLIRLCLRHLPIITERNNMAAHVIVGNDIVPVLPFAST